MSEVNGTMHRILEAHKDLVNSVGSEDDQIDEMYSKLYVEENIYANGVDKLAVSKPLLTVQRIPTEQQVAAGYKRLWTMSLNLVPSNYAHGWFINTLMKFHPDPASFRQILNDCYTTADVDSADVLPDEKFIVDADDKVERILIDFLATFGVLTMLYFRFGSNLNDDIIKKRYAAIYAAAAEPVPANLLSKECFEEIARTMRKTTKMSEHIIRLWTSDWLSSAGSVPLMGMKKCTLSMSIFNGMNKFGQIVKYILMRNHPVMYHPDLQTGLVVIYKMVKRMMAEDRLMWPFQGYLSRENSYNFAQKILEASFNLVYRVALQIGREENDEMKKIVHDMPTPQILDIISSSRTIMIVKDDRLVNSFTKEKLSVRKSEGIQAMFFDNYVAKKKAKLNNGDSYFLLDDGPRL